MSLPLMITAALAASGAVFLALTLIARSQYGQEHRIREGRNHNLAPAKYTRVAVFNSLFSVVLVYAYTFTVGPHLFHEGPASLVRILVEGVAILFAFDFFYYFLHRYPFHEWSLLKKVHGGDLEEGAVDAPFAASGALACVPIS